MKRNIAAAALPLLGPDGWSLTGALISLLLAAEIFAAGGLRFRAMIESK